MTAQHPHGTSSIERIGIDESGKGDYFGPLVIAALGGHVIKTGCAPYLNDWIQRGILHGVALNGAAAVHDLELAIAGRTVIKQSEGARVGRKLADTAWWLSVLGLAATGSYLYVNQAVINRDSARAAELGVTSWHVSLSHDAGVASAVVVAEG